MLLPLYVQACCISLSRRSDASDDKNTSFADDEIEEIPLDDLEEDYDDENEDFNGDY